MKTKAQKRTISLLGAIALATAPAFVMVGCDDTDEPMEEVGESLDDAADEVGDSIDDVADDLDG